MTPEEMVAAMADKTEHDDAYIEMLGKEFASLGIEGLEKFVDAFNARKSSFTPEQQQNISRVNHALAKNAGFCDALKKLHEHREAQARPDNRDEGQKKRDAIIESEEQRNKR